MRAKLVVLCSVLMVVAASGCTSRNPATPGDGGPDGDGQTNNTGQLGGPCYPNNTCNSGLVCRNNVCVRATDGGPDIGGDTRGDLPAGDTTRDASTDGDATTDADAAIVDAGDATTDGIPPDGPSEGIQPDTSADTSVDGPSVTCSPPGHRAVVSGVSSAGDWHLILEPQTTYKAITIASPTAQQAAGVFDYNVSLQQVAGFAVSRSTSATDLAGLLTEVRTALNNALFSNVTVISNGLTIKTHDNYDARVQITIQLTAASASDVSLQRNRVLAALLGVAQSNLSGLPSNYGVPATDFTLRLAALLRGTRAIFVGAVVDTASDNDFTKNTRLIAHDIASASGLARASATPTTTCESQTVTQPVSPVDIIWVMDESGSMQTKRANIAANATAFFNQATQRGLNFRMGVTNVVDPNGTWSAGVGKFCSVASTDPNHNGGPDRFLLPTERTIFEACINNPPGYEGGQEYGLVNARAAVTRHIPRAANAVDKIRTGAQLVIIVVTDEVPQSLSTIIGAQNFSVCTLPNATQTAVDQALKPTIDLFSGTAAAGADAKLDFFQAIAGACQNTCGSGSFVNIAHGYKEVAAAFNGGVYDICEANLGPAITKIINDIQAASAQIKLQHQGIAPTVNVAVNNSALQRSLTNGFNFNPATNTLAFPGASTISVGSTVTIAYKYW